MNLLQRVVLAAPAKINLFLDITGRRPDGYHLIDTVMQAVSLCDIVVVGKRPWPGIRVTCSRPGIPEDSRNFVHKAAVRFAETAGIPKPGVHIHIDKAIPSQAGLGGGSSDAAAALVGLQALTGVQLPPDKLHRLAVQLGADVPFFLDGGCARAQGIGDEFTPLCALPTCSLAIAKPSAGVSTQQAYRDYDGNPGVEHRSVTDMMRFIGSRNLAKIAAECFNVFEQVIPQADTAQIREEMLAHGAHSVLLSGSGSAVFGVFSERSRAAAAVDALLPTVARVFLTEPVDCGVRILHRS